MGLRFGVLALGLRFGLVIPDGMFGFSWGCILVCLFLLLGEFRFAAPLF